MPLVSVSFWKIKSYNSCLDIQPGKSEHLVMTRTGSVEPAPSVLCIGRRWVDQFPREGYWGVEDRGPVGAELNPVIGEQEGGEEEQEREVEEGRGEGGGEIGHPAPHNGEGRGITLGENLEEYFLCKYFRETRLVT